MTRPLIDVRDLVKTYGRHAAVDGLSFQVVPQTPHAVPDLPEPAASGTTTKATTRAARTPPAKVPDRAC